MSARVKLRAVCTTFTLAASLSVAVAPVTSAAELPEAQTLRGWIEAMKASPRGPFERLRWFCKDGTVLPPKPGACGPHGGGVQHGEWNERTVRLREGGYHVGNVLAELEPDDFVGPDADLDALRQILIERFLIGWDDGWIFRGARSYRGALQAEDEEAAARAVMLAMLADPLWRDPGRFALLRESARLLPVRTEESLASEVRLAALEIAADDPDFMPLRAKIHSSPDPSDAERVRAYAGEGGRAELAERYAALASSIDELYGSDAAESIETLAEGLEDLELRKLLADGGQELRATEIPGQRLAILARLLAGVRDRFARIQSPEMALAALEASLAIEDEVFAAANALTLKLDGYSRVQRLWLLEYSSQALYGAGFLSSRHVKAVSDSVIRLEKDHSLTVEAYRREIAFVARVPEWCNRWLVFNFGPAIERLAPIEPEVHLYSQDRLRGSAVLFYSATVDTLSLDVDALAGIRHELFGESIGAGLRALNPGLAEGTLWAEAGREPERDGIYLLPETTSHLPRVSGILTEGEGSSLSHIQLLARNLGIPNVVVGKELLARVRAKSGRRVVMAVSPGGVVQLAASGPEWDQRLGKEELLDDVVIRPDLEKLDLTITAPIGLSNLRATDSGRISGPKGANLGELKFLFGDAVPGGFVIPFGAFRSLLDRELEPGGPSVFDWMVARYDAIEAAESDPKQQAKLVADFLERFRGWIATTELPQEFLASLRAMLEQTFGPGDGNYGVFVRSDTNVEDLPGFTGAGLNLTVANVWGFDNIVAALREVWASPFTERAFGWRQSNMDQPEYVFPAVVVQRATPSEKSGVMVTTDVEGGGMRFATVAVNEGVGGAVDGQASESLRIDLESGGVRFLAQATAPERVTLVQGGGVIGVPASGTDAVLKPDEVRQLAALAKSLPKKFPSIQEDGKPAPADVEFAFLEGKLVLLQIRPFVESKRARAAGYLRDLDAGLRERGKRSVDLQGVPGDSAAEGAP